MHNKLLFVINSSIMKLKIPGALFIAGIIICNAAFAQIHIDNAVFYIQSGGSVVVQGDVTSNVDIEGTGKLLLKGTATQNIDMGGFNIPNMELDNAANAVLLSNAKISTLLLFKTGKIILGTKNLTISDTIKIIGPGASKFIETNSTGVVFKTLTADITNAVIPVGLGTDYLPAFVTSTGTYLNANVGVKVLATADPNKPVMIADYLLTHWPVTKTGVTGTVQVKGQYSATANVSGTEAKIRGYFFNGADWSSAGEAHDAALHSVTATIGSASGDIYGMDKFILSKTKVFLQAVYNTTTGVMADNLRKPTNLIPLSDPYKTAPYNINFISVADPVVATANASVFANHLSSDSDVVDWVFIELRSSTISPGNTVLQTRSALLQRNGNVVDVDGKSLVTFNNVIDGNYTIAIRHRNHLGISTNPATNLIALSEATSTAPLVDFTTATDANIFGPASAYAIALNGKNVLWGGNANINGNVRYNGAANDKDHILLTTLSNNVALVINNVYDAADLNMNRNVRYNGAANDKDFILLTVLGNNIAGIKLQALPN